MPRLVSLLLLVVVFAGVIRLDRSRPRSDAAAPPAHAGPPGPRRLIASVEARDGFTLQLLAAEPLVTSPVAMTYDEDGRAYVVEMVDYPYTDRKSHQPWKENTTDLPLGRIRRLVDRDGDGVFDHATVFAEGLSWPTGIAVWKNGVYVTATPDLWYFEDRDGDGKADRRRRVFTGFRKFNVQAVINNLAWGLDHRIYAAGGTNGGLIRHVDRPDDPPVVLSRNDFCFDATTERVHLLSGGARFGNTFDDWGNRFICNIRNPVIHPVLPHHALLRNPFLPVGPVVHDAADAGDALPVYRLSPPEPWRAARSRRWLGDPTVKMPRSELNERSFTSACGLTIYRGTAYPAGYRGNVFLCEVAGNLIHRQTLQPDGVTFRARRAEAGTEFLRSRSNWFRPVNLLNAPDGTLHVLDMCRETIEHPWSIPDDLHAGLDLLSGRDRGRIYRLAPPGFRPPPPPRLSRASTPALVAQLENRNAWWRETAHRLLFQRQDRAAVAPLRELLRRGEEPLARLHALWSLAGLEALADADLLTALDDAAAPLREHAVRLAEPRLRRSADLLRRVLHRADDAAPRVRFQAALSLGEADDRRVGDALLGVLRRDGADRWLRTAALSSATAESPRLLVALLNEAAPTPGGDEAARDLALVVAARGRNDEVRAVLGALAEVRSVERRATVLTALGEGLRRARRTLRGVSRDLSAPVVTMIDGYFAAGRAAAGSPTATPADRLAAVAALGLEEFDRAGPTLAALIDPRHDQATQLAAVRALAGFSDRSVSALLLASWPTLTPAVRGEAAEALLARPERIPPLLDAIEARRVAASDLPPTRRALLRKHPNAVIRTRANAVLGAEPAGNRREVVTAYRAALRLAADPARGEKVYQRECAACHRLGSQGHDVGPHLSTVAHLTAEEVLVSILDPNREVSPNYLDYLVTREDGRVTSGMIAAESAVSLTLRRSGGVEETVLRRDLDAVQSTGRSLMPEGLEKRLTPQEVADLLALLLRRR